MIAATLAYFCTVVLGQAPPEEDAWSRPLHLRMQPTDGPPEIDDAWSRPLNLRMQPEVPTVTPNDAWSRPLHVRMQPQAPDPAPNDAWSRPLMVTMRAAEPDPNPNDAWSRPLSVVPKCIVRLTVIFEDYLANVPQPAKITYQFVTPGGDPVGEGDAWVIGGKANLGYGVNEEVFLRVRASHWLVRQVTTDFTSVDELFMTVSLINGDIDQDNEVGPGDFNELANAFLSVDGDPNWNANADLDGDGEVGPGDFSILANNFLLAGD